MGKPYKYTLSADFYIQTNIRGRRFTSEWLEIEPDGDMVVKKGYSWDGCSPKVKIFGRIVGTLDTKGTYYASCVHDAIYQYKGDCMVSRKEADALFLEMLLDSGFLLSYLYFACVRAGGWVYGGWGV
jgi:hypothetical protein